MDTRKLIYELLDFVDDVADHVGSRHILEQVPNILINGTGADRQLAVYNKTGSLPAVVDYIHESFLP